MTAALEYQERIRKDPKFFVRETLGVTLFWKGMDEMLAAMPRAIEERKPIVVGSGHALSKDFTMSGCAPLWFLTAYGPQCKIAMTAPTDRQVKKVMWAELSTRYNGSVLKDSFGRLLVCNLQVTDEWFILAFTTKETGGGVGKFQGFHTPAIMVVVSEGQAVTDDIYDQIDGITTSEISLLVVLGNPIRTTGRYVQMLKDKRRNIVINLSCLDSPNVIAKKEVIPGMCSFRWVEDKRQRWNADGSGRDPRWMGRVLGLVPKTAVNNVISEELYDSCIGRQLFETVRRGAIGVDPARFGDDEMVISVFEKGELIDEKAIPKCDAVEGAGEIILMQKKHFPEGQIAIVVDCDGLGGPFLDIAKRMAADELQIVWVEFHGSCNDRSIVDADYENHRAEAAFFAAEKMREGKVCLNDNEFAKEEAVETTYFPNLRGRIQIEDKQDLKERLERSPNRWDARTLAIWGLYKFAPIIKPRDSWARSQGAAASRMLPNIKSAMGA